MQDSGLCRIVAESRWAPWSVQFQIQMRMDVKGRDDMGKGEEIYLYTRYLKVCAVAVCILYTPMQDL